MGGAEIWDKLWAKEPSVRGNFRKRLIDYGYTFGVYTLHLSKELKLDYGTLLEWRHRLQELAFENRDISVLPYPVQEVVIFEWAYNLKDKFQELIRAMVIPDYTLKPI